MPINTKRYNDPVDPSDGHRLLVCRYLPRGVAKSAQTWHAWDPSLGPSVALHRAVYPKSGSPLPWPIYRQRYLAEQRANRAKIQALAQRIQAGETITLLCSSACIRESRCHRSLLKDLIEQAAQSPEPQSP